ncbi:hypothetical protein FIV00_05730 [Labrenzia sp. THAF82]|uniref:hypothetical protein n=1 Tax=Labrenzia sp. THAF82 TaxID=2587861 RepID=UPI001268AD19|nr:hypothetical protein [Labrenzia sp. THAF82]QFT29962.1 hypothetical protein FIV00_05730 [Labrenzia sp. THAF82]
MIDHLYALCNLTYPSELARALAAEPCLAAKGSICRDAISLIGFGHTTRTQGARTMRFSGAIPGLDKVARMRTVIPTPVESGPKSMISTPATMALPYSTSDNAFHPTQGTRP